jgi:uncharacterized DUF497 family protein
MAYEFRWNDWNVEHVGAHDVTPKEAEYIVNRPERGYPQKMEDEKYLVKGQTAERRYLQVIYIFSPAAMVYVVYARDMTANEKKNLRSKRR